MRNPKPRPMSLWWRLELTLVALLMAVSAAVGVAGWF